MEYWPCAFPIWFRKRIPGPFGNQPVGSILPYSLDPSTLPDGALPSPWVGSTFTISSGKIINTPTEGSSVSTNGNMETGDPPSGWVPTNVTLVADADAHGGSQAAKATSTAAGGTIGQNLTVTSGLWYVPSIWAKKTAGGNLDLLMSIGAFSSTQYNLPYHLSPTSYTNYRGAVLTNGTTLSCHLRGFDNGTEAYWDDVTVKPLTTSELFATINANAADVTVKANITLVNYSPAGVICNLDSTSTPKYYILAFISPRSRLGMFKCINGTITQLIDAAATYSAGALLEIRKTASDTYQAWYNGSQIGTDQTVTDATLNAGTRHGIFSTGGGSQVSNFFVVAA